MLGEILMALNSHQGEELQTEVGGVELISSFARTFALTFALTFARTAVQGIKTRVNQEKVCTVFSALQWVVALIKFRNAIKRSFGLKVEPTLSD